MADTHVVNHDPEDYLLYIGNESSWPPEVTVAPHARMHLSERALELWNPDNNEQWAMLERPGLMMDARHPGERFFIVDAIQEKYPEDDPRWSDVPGPRPRHNPIVSTEVKS